jgi:sodium transport system permease protein
MRGAFLIVKKEFMELSKDRKTMFFTFLMPLILYPLLFTMMNRLGNNDEAKRVGKPSRVFLLDASQALAPTLRADPQHFQLMPRPEGGVKQAIRDQRLELALEVDDQASEKLARYETFSLKALYDHSDETSSLALDRLKDALKRQDTQWVQARLKAVGAGTQLAVPSALEVAEAGDMGLTLGKIVGSFLPYLLVIMMYVGSMQHGIYVTAGEKERGTLLSLLATSLPRNQIIIGKLLYIFLIGLLTALVHLFSMALSVGYVMAGHAAAGPAGAAGAAGAMSGLAALANPWTMGLTFVLMVPLGLLFANFILLGGIQAKTTVEAGTALTPGSFVVIFLGVFSMAPGIEKMAFLPYIPVVNVSLAIRKLFSQQANPWEYVVALTMTTALAALMTWVSTRMLNRESAIFKV